MTESVFELARSNWNCIPRRSLHEGEFEGERPAHQKKAPDFSVIKAPRGPKTQESFQKRKRNKKKQRNQQEAARSNRSRMKTARRLKRGTRSAEVVHRLALFNFSGAFRSLAAQVLGGSALIFVEKSIKKMIKQINMFFIVFDRFWDPFWSLLGGQKRPKMGQVGLKTALETHFFEKREISRKPIKTNEKSIKMTPRSVPKRPKIAPKRFQGGLEEVFFAHRFLSSIFVHFGSDFGSLWGPFWALLGVQNRQNK